MPRGWPSVLRCSGSRESIHALIRHLVCCGMQHRVSGSILCPLAQPKKAIGLDPETRCCRSEEHTSELQSRGHLVCRLLLEKKKLATSQRRTVHTQYSLC